MTPEERDVALAPFGFSKRQTRFLDLVMRHSGVCVPRQYATHAGIVQGQKTRAFFAKLVRRGFASVFECRHNRGRVYHVHHHALYAAVGAPNSRYRRLVSAGSTPGRLMILDALLAGRDIMWLATRAELRNHFRPPVSAVGNQLLPDPKPLSSLSALAVDSTRVGVDSTGRSVLLYVVSPGSCEDFHALLRRAAAVLSGLTSWTLRIAVPKALTQVYEAYQQALREEWESPLQAQTVDELCWYFERRRDLPPDRRPFPSDARFDRAAAMFDGPRFDRLYRRWRREGAVALAGASSQGINDALASGAGRVEHFTLDHSYDHLSPVLTPSGAMTSAPYPDVDKRRPTDTTTTASVIQS